MSTLTLPSHMGKLTVHPFNRPAMAFFSLVGLLMQFPVILVYGFGKRSNVPITIMSSWFLYFNMSNFISAVAWRSDTPDEWWSGAGWCDMDVRLRAAGGIAVLIVQCVSNYNMAMLLSDRPRLITLANRKRNNIIEAVVCMALPACIFVLITFTTYNRYDVVQYSGCTMNGDTSPATIVVYLIWLPILAVLCLVSFIVVVVKFAKRGKTAAFETVSFITDMTPMQFMRLAIFGCVMTLVICPLSMYVGIWNLVHLANAGITKSAWAHGKPADWGVVHRATWKELALAAKVSGANLDPVMGLTMTLKIVNVALSWVLFLCYGTGSLATERYRAVAQWLHILGPTRARKTNRKTPADIETTMYRDTLDDEHIQKAMEAMHPEVIENDRRWAHLMHSVPQSAKTEDSFEKGEGREHTAIRSLSLSSSESQERMRYSIPVKSFFSRS